jgi:hypothetical protein
MVQLDLANALMSPRGWLKPLASGAVKDRHAGPSAVLRLDSSRHPGFVFGFGMKEPGFPPARE